MGRPSTFTPEIGDAICGGLVEGLSLRTICAADGMPNPATVYRWLREHDGFREQYTRAREDQAEGYADEIVEIADEECTMVKSSKHPTAAKDDEEELEVVFDSTAVARNRLRVEARKWTAAKLLPKKYGDRQTIEHEGNISLIDRLKAAQERASSADEG